jgi:hypothetical protein
VKAEYGDAARVARRLGVPLREVSRRAEQKVRRPLAAVEDLSSNGVLPPDGEAG